jgi:chitosanase
VASGSPEQPQNSRTNVWSGSLSRRGFIIGAAGLTSVIAIGVASSPKSDAFRGVTPSRYTAAVTKEIALELVSTAENSTKDWTLAYPYIQDINDGRGYTGGIVGWCSGTGDMLTLVKYYALTTPDNLLRKYIPRMQQIMAAPEESRPRLSHVLLGPAFTSDWATAAKTAQFQAAQRAQRDLVLWDPALAGATEDGLGRLGLYIYYDIAVNQGTGTDPQSLSSLVAGVKAAGQQSPARGGDEVDFLAALVDARDQVLRAWGSYQADGRDTIARKFLSDENLNLILPLRWTVYSDDYSITSLPVPM